MTFRIGICDDMPEAITVLQKHIEHYQIAHDANFIIDSFTSGQELLQSHNECPYHIILLDIEMPNQNGIDIARHLRNQGDYEVFIVFVTSYSQYMMDSFEVQPFQFLTKPAEFHEVEKLISNIIRRYQHSHTTKILIGIGGEEYTVRISDIIYMKTIKSKRPILEYILQDMSLTARGTIQNWEYILNDYGFISPCRGYLVNVRHIYSFNDTRIVMTNDIKIPISRRRVKLVKQTYLNRIIHLMN